MDIKLEIFAGTVADSINSAIEYIHIDTDDVINSIALVAQGEIRSVLQDPDIDEDFDVVERIVCIFEKYNIDAGFRHDF